ncbi:Type IV secretory system Conjugative DNA transfer [Nitrosospira multiformis ATCC 25196]|uniref:TRAG protein n=1 Tax=Nitrosospira multiformis (strain ATCC 25196 / NCIMB 11849 / C 71) TaxID=323848 RepID=Q2Y574_NITMU|nr:type IV secretory system conjugative DNA transfer family protein [Nitrosospira multiformis]ABB76097.1 TRAG protein [Nitrosospira multiformis ATCC 25196]SEG16660.1 Type IV secretory system Conjugative DNA transfer [Nitrosospira multiformis ATCC 25196]
MGNDILALGESQPKYNRRALASAQFIPQEYLDRQGYRKGDFWLGRTLNGRPFGWNEEMNLLTCAGPGAGKGVSTVVPNLLEFPGSAVVVDPKGELASMTAAFRRDVLGQKVIVLDPARTAKVSEDLRGTYNPFDELDADDPFVTTAAQVIASGIVVPNPKAKEPFWDDNALDFIQSCILYMVRHYPPNLRTLMKLRETVSMGDSDLFDAYVRRKQEEDPDFMGSESDAFGLFLKEMFNTPDFGGVIRETAAKIGRMGENTKGSVLSTAATHLDFVKSPELWDVLQSNPDPSRTFRLRELRRNDRPLTVYLCLPVDMIPRQGRWFRMIISRIIQSIERSEFDKKRDHPVLMMIDEFFQLGPIPSITNTLTYSRSFGLRLWLIVQDLNQLKTNYPDAWETILGSCGIKQFFGVNDLVTAKYVSELIGEEEIDIPSISLTKTSSGTESRNSSQTHSQGMTSTAGNNWSSSTGRSVSFSRTNSTNHNITTGRGISNNQAASSGVSESWGSGANNGETITNSQQTSQNSGRSAHATTGQNYGVSSSLGQSSSLSGSAGQSASSGMTFGSSISDTRGGSISTSESRNISNTAGEGSSVSTGINYAFSVSKQKRRLLRPEDVLVSFTKKNLVQLTHIRDQGGMMLFRTPFYADPYFRFLLTEKTKNDT